MNEEPRGKLRTDKIAIHCAKCGKFLQFVHLDRHRNRTPTVEEARSQAYGACYNLLRDYDGPSLEASSCGQPEMITGPSFTCTRKVCGRTARYKRSHIESLVLDAIMSGKTWVKLETVTRDWGSTAMRHSREW